MVNIELIKNKIHPICKQYRIDHMYLFGSQARGDAKADSDIDFYLDKAGSIKSILTLSGFWQDLQDCLGKKVDIVTKLDDGIFKDYVDRDKVVIYENK